MTSISSTQDAEATTLPQYGFGTDVDFDNLIKDNHFLFRVYTPRERSPFFDDTDPFFIAPKFNERYNLSPAQLSQWRANHGAPPPYVGTFRDVVTHMDWTTRSSSPYISTSFSFIWSIWEALRRYHQGVKKDVQIAVIDASAVSGRAATAIQLLRQSSPSERPGEYWKWYRFSQESQSVLVHESIPGAAVLASVPLLSLLEKLPSYFLRPEIPLASKGSALAAVAWDYTEKKRSYRRFCQDMSTRFLQLPPEARLQDTTTGSVRLAMSFLRPWFHKCVTDDFQTATVTLCALAFSIAQWPGQWWAQEHSEMWSLIRVMALSLAEEVREKQRGQTAEVNRLQGVISELEGAVKNYERELASRPTKKPARLLAPLTIPPPLRPAVMPFSPSPFTLGPSHNAPIFIPQARSLVPTPITPPTSPIRSAAPAFPIKVPPTPIVQVPATPSPTLSFVLIDNPLTPLPNHDVPPSPLTSDSGTVTDVELPEELTPKKGFLLLEEGPSSQPSTQITIPSSISPAPSAGPSSSIGSLSPSVPSSPVETLVDLPTPTQSPSVANVELPLDLLTPQSYLLSDPRLYSPSVDRQSEEQKRVRRPPSAAETASCLVTGFLVGAFITLCLLSPHRRTLLTNLT